MNTVTITANSNVISVAAGVQGPQGPQGIQGIPGVQIQADWTQATTSALDYIKNKPVVPVLPTNATGFLTNNGSGSLSWGAVSVLSNNGHTLSMGSTGNLTFPDSTVQSTAYVEPNRTNHFFVDPFRSSQSYTPTGSIIKPYFTIGAAQTAIEALITAGTIVPGESNPIFIVLMGNITENVTLTRGHVFLTSLTGTIHQPIYLSGSITVSGSNSSTGALDANHFSIQGITISATAQKACIYFT